MQLIKEKQAFSGLSDSLKRELEDQLLYGDLLEVTTDETTTIWQTLQTNNECLNYFNMTDAEAAKTSLQRITAPRKVS